MDAIIEVKEGRARRASPDPTRVAATIEAVLLSADRPVGASRLAEVASGGDAAEGDSSEADAQPGAPAAGDGRSPLVTPSEVDRAIAALNAEYESTGRAFRVESVAGGYRLMTLPEHAPALAAYHRTRAASRLTRAALETLAIIAYKQPITRAHLEAIRGVACGEVLRSLMERRLVTIQGRAEELGRPILYGTTREFLDAFGLASVKDLPEAADALPGL